MSRAVLFALLAGFASHQLLTPVLAPLSRQLHLSDWQLGLVITAAAAALTVASPLWGRAIDRWGNRRVLLAGLGLAALGLTGFAVFAALGLDGAAAPVTLAGLLVTRSVLFGAGIAALPVCALAMAAASSQTEAERTRATGLVGAAQGLSLVIGPAIGGVLALGSLLAPIFAAPAVMLALMLWIATRATLGTNPAPSAPTTFSATTAADSAPSPGLAASSAAHATPPSHVGASGAATFTPQHDPAAYGANTIAESVAPPHPVPFGAADSAPPLGPATVGAGGAAGGRIGAMDPRVLPHLFVGFTLFLSLGLMQVNIGFLLADRLGLSDRETASTVGAALFVTGLALALIQGVVIPRLAWPPSRLLRVGAPIAALAYALLVPAHQLWIIIVSMVLLAVGLGLSMPGYAAAATLAVPPDQHGSISGLVNATNGLTWIIGPLLGTALYERSPATPIVVALALCLIASAAVWRPARHRAPEPQTVEQILI